MRGLSSDIRYALRTLRYDGTSTLVAMLSLAVGVGANAAIFSIGYAMLVHPLPYTGADRLVMLRPMNPSHGALWTTVAPANLLDWHGRSGEHFPEADVSRVVVTICRIAVTR